MVTRFGVVGTAFWAEHAHLPGLRSVPGAELVGLWGRNPDRARALAAAAGTDAFDTFEAMLDAVDAVSFAVPPAVQAGLALRAARAGKHLLLEKPVAFETRDADAIADAVAARGLASVVFLVRRFMPEIEAGLAALRDRRFERVEVSIMGGAMLPHSGYENSVWRREAHAVVWDLVPHVLSILVPLLGPLRQLALIDETPELTRLAGEHAGGTRVEMRLSQRAPKPLQGNVYVFTGPDGTATLPEPPMDRPALHARAVRALLGAIGGTPSPWDARFGAEITRTIARALP